jgi:hypothetical protein
MMLRISVVVGLLLAIVMQPPSSYAPQLPTAAASQTDTLRYQRRRRRPNSNLDHLNYSNIHMNIVTHYLKPLLHLVTTGDEFH